MKLVAVLLLSLIPFSVSMAYEVSYATWFCVIIIAACFIGIIISLCGATLLCPTCRRNLDGGLGAFCPECGGGLRYFEGEKVPECQDCGARPRFARQARGGEVRAFKIKSCTYCGIKLHESGV